MSTTVDLVWVWVFGTQWHSWTSKRPNLRWLESTVGEVLEVLGHRDLRYNDLLRWRHPSVYRLSPLDQHTGILPRCG